MSEEDKAKRMKEQVEALKKKYLKKTASKDALLPVAIIEKEQKNIPDYQAPKKQIETNQKDINLVQSNIKKEQPKKTMIEDKRQKEWSVRNIMQEQPQPQAPVDQNDTQKQFYEMEVNENDPFRLRTNTSKKRTENSQDVQADAQFVDLQQDQEQPEEARHKVKRNPQIGETCHRWKKSPRQALQYLMFDQQALIKSDKEIMGTELILKSKNPNFPGIVQNLAMQFIFKNPHPLSELQKDVVYEMAITYFSPSPKVLSDVLLISIIKIGAKCLKNYAQELLDKIQYYFQRVLIFKDKYLLSTEVDGMVAFLNEKVENSRRQGATIPIKLYLWCLLLKPSDAFLHQLLLPVKFENVSDLFTIFCILEPVDSNQGLSLLYLRCVDELVPVFAQYHIIEDVIENFKKMKVPQSLYKHVKSLKLKLIRYADSSGMLRKPSQQEKGFMNFLNDKMGKLKGKLDTSMISKSKLELYFDQALGQYKTNN